MDWLTFVSAIIKSIAWPLVVGIVLVVLRRDIGTLLRTLAPRLQKAKGPWGELAFGESIDEVEEKLPPAEAKAMTEGENKRIDEVSDLARLPPAYIASQAWLRLVEVIRKVADEYIEPSEDRPMSIGECIRV